MSLRGHCWVSSVPKYRSWAEGRLGAGSLHTAKLNRDLLGVQKFRCLGCLVGLGVCSSVLVQEIPKSTQIL